MRILIVIIYVSFSLKVISQNFVRNWNFEDTISCPTGREQLNKATYWFTPRGGGDHQKCLTNVITIIQLHLVM